MLRLEAGLSPELLDAIAGLERRVVEADGGRLKLEWGVLRGRTSDQVRDALWWQDGELVGFLGCYGFRGAPVELAGMVDPGHRRRGIGTQLLEAALPLCRETGDGTALLVVPGASAGGHAIAGRFGGRLDHSEHALRLDEPPVDGPSDESLTMRPAIRDDFDTVAVLLAAAFGDDPQTARAILDRDLPDTAVALRDGTIVAALRLERADDGVGVYGFGVAPSMQGQGIGRDILRRVCRQAFDDGAEHVHLEVAVDNAAALGLYTSLGFRPVTTEDYFAVPVPS